MVRVVVGGKWFKRVNCGARDTFPSIGGVTSCTLRVVLVLSTTLITLIKAGANVSCYPYNNNKLQLISCDLTVTNEVAFWVTGRFDEPGHDHVELVDEDDLPVVQISWQTTPWTDDNVLLSVENDVDNITVSACMRAYIMLHFFQSHRNELM